MATRRHERPLRRVNPSGKVVFVARWTDRQGRRYSAGTFDLKRDAQAAIDTAYDREYGDGPRATTRDTVGGYSETWLKRHPRSDRSNDAYAGRVRVVLDVRVGGKALRHWRLDEVRRREIVDLVDVMLRKQGRSAEGARVILRALSQLWEDAITDDRAGTNPVVGVKVRSSDPRVQKPSRRIRVWSWEQMHGFAAAAPGVYGPAMVRTLADCGLRLGEMLPLERDDLKLGACAIPECPVAGVHLHVRRTAFHGRVLEGTKSHRHDPTVEEMGRVAPVGPALEGLLRALPARLDTRLLFPAEGGGVLQTMSWYKEFWWPTRKVVAGMEAATTHELRHSWVTHMRAAGIDPADVANVAGHTVETATRHYTHPLGLSYDAMRAQTG